jgi:hypothetical protein
LENLTAVVALQASAGNTEKGPYVYIVQSPELSLAPSETKVLNLTIVNGGKNIFTFKPILEQRVSN